MKRYIHVLAIYIFATLVLASCSSFDVSNNHDPDYNYSGLKTYGWIDNPDIKLRDPLAEKLFRKTMETQLQAKGFTKQESAPDFNIAYHGLNIERRVEVTNWGYNYGQWSSGFDVYQYEEGSIVIDFIDAKTKELIYRSQLSAIIDPNTSFEARKKRTEEATQLILKNFPPR